MATQKLEDVINFVETQLNTVDKLDQVVYQGADDQDPKVKDYGAVIYIGLEEPVERENLHIGPHLTETWSINVDIIIKRKPPTPRKTVSDPFGTSFWIDTITALFLNKTNSGAFVRTQWLSDEVEEINSGIKLKGLFTCELLNKYT